jgi:hypothetical protein
MYLYIVIVSIIIFFIFHYIDVARNIRLQKPPSSISTKIAILFFSFILTSMFFYLFWDTQNSTKITSGGDNLDFLENAHLNYITEDIQCGFPPF